MKRLMHLVSAAALLLAAPVLAQDSAPMSESQRLEAERQRLDAESDSLDEAYRKLHETWTTSDKTDEMTGSRSFAISITSPDPVKGKYGPARAYLKMQCSKDKIRTYVTVSEPPH